jgi:hypothetical protein
LAKRGAFDFRLENVAVEMRVILLHAMRPDAVFLLLYPSTEIALDGIWRDRLRFRLDEQIRSIACRKPVEIIEAAFVHFVVCCSTFARFSGVSGQQEAVRPIYGGGAGQP